MKKKVECILLNTKKNTNTLVICRTKEKNKMSHCIEFYKVPLGEAFGTPEGRMTYHGSDFVGNILSYNHLYFISDDEIVDGDWCINKNKDTLYQKDEYPMDISWKKVVATTNPELWVTKQSEFITTSKGGIFKIGDDFISAYIKAYNESKPTTEVNLEYNDCTKFDDDNFPQTMYNTLKLHPNGTVIISPIKEDLNPNNLKVGEEYWIKYLPYDSIWQHVKITRFTDRGYAWGEGQKLSRFSGIIAQDLYDIKPFTKFSPKVEKTYTYEQLSAISFTSFIVGIANPQLSATELVEFHKEWFDRNYSQ